MKRALDPPIPRSTPGRLTSFSNRRWRHALLGAVAIASTGLAACDSNEGEQRADLEAILKDGDLKLVAGGALTFAPAGTAGASADPGATPVPPPRPPMGSGTGGSIGSGGSTPAVDAGSAGGSADGGSTDAIAGEVFAEIGGEVGGTGGFIGDGGFAGMGGRGGTGGSGGPFPQSAQGLWQFENCNSSRTDLNDSSFNSHTAFRSVSVACTPGVVDQGVAIDEDDDLVYVPDQPSFTFENGVTVAAWVKPTKLGGIRTIFRKRELGTSTFVLLENGKNYQFVIRLANGRAAEVNAKATLNTFTHVAGTYDGHDLRLYLNGKLAAHTRVNGTLSNGAGPLLMGNDGLERRIDGVLDNVFFDTRAATADQIVRLTCLPKPSLLVATPATSGPVAAGTEVPFDVRFTNNSCDQVQFQFSAFASNPSIFVNPSFDFRSAEAGTTTQIPITVSSSADAEPDDYPISISVFPFSRMTREFLTTSVVYSVKGTPCSVRSRRELEIRDLSVVEDPIRTAPGGAWTFGKLMENMAASPSAAPAMVESLLSTWLTDQTVNGFTVAARPAMQDRILGSFPRMAGGDLDLSHAPFRLLAIVNRIDLNDVTKHTAGEGRFVFGILDRDGNPMEMTMILEYNIPTGSAQEITDLAKAWHNLTTLTFPSEQYNTALQVITDHFAGRNAAPMRVNGSAIGQVRTNDFFALGEWEFREFHLSASGTLVPATLALTPDRSFNFSQTLADYINANESSILTETHTVPETFAGQSFQAGSMITDFFVWDAPGVNPNAREKFALNTCNGCHTSPLETNVFVFQVSPRGQGQESSLSPFLQGTEVFDPFANVTRVFNELGRRGRILHNLVCPDEPLPPPPPDTIPGPSNDGGFGGFGGGPSTDGGFGGGPMGGGAGGSAGGAGDAGAPGPFPPPKL